MDRDTSLAAASRDGHLALRRVERQQALIERLHASRGERIQLGELARDLGVSVRTIARDVERLRLSGVPLHAYQGRAGGVRLRPTRPAIALELQQSRLHILAVHPTMVVAQGAERSGGVRKCPVARRVERAACCTDGAGAVAGQRGGLWSASGE